MRETPETDERILSAARWTFARRGLTGARVQEVASRAGVNKALVHYYYRSKERLFEQVLQRAVTPACRRMRQPLNASLPVVEKVVSIAHALIDVFAEDPDLPALLLHGNAADPQHLGRFLHGDCQRGFETLRRQIVEAAGGGHLRPVAPEQLLTHLIAFFTERSWQ